VPEESRRAVRAVAASVTVGFAGALVWLTPIGPALEAGFGLTALFHLRGVRPVTEPVAIVAVDRSATSHLWLRRTPARSSPCEGAAAGPHAPGPEWVNPPAPTRLSSWPRCLHGLLVRRLHEAGARAVVFDMLFRPREPAFYGFDVAADDALFAQALRAAGNVVVGHKVEQDTTGSSAEHAGLAPLARDIHDAALAAAPFPLPEPRDQVRRAALFFDGEPPLPTLPAVAYHAFVDGSRAEAVLAQSAGLNDETGRRLPLLSRTAALRQHFVAGDATRMPVAAAGDATVAALLDLFGGPPVRHINFHGPPGTVPTIGYDAVIAGAPDALQRLRGRTVFVGYAESAQAEPHDDHRTVFAGPRANMHGVEIAATTFANIHARAFLREPSPAVTALIVFVAGAAATAAVLAGNAGIGLLGVGVLGAVWLAVAWFAFRSSFLWLPIVGPLAVQLPAGVLVALGWRYREALQQRARLQRAFANFVPPDVANRLTQNAQALHTLRRRVQAACMATDAHRYTSLAERLAPEALLEFLNRYYEPLFDAVARHGGFVSDVVGDSMVAIWPEGDDDAAVRARVCAACLSLIEGADQLAEREPETALLTRVGVAWGPIVLAPVGALNHYEYRGVGDAVNTANRLQSLAGKLGVRIAVARELVAGLETVVTRELGDFLLKGKSEPVHVVEIVAAADRADAATRARCAAFDDAVAAWRRGDVVAARARLEALHLSQPGDGPVNYLLGRLAPSGTRERLEIPVV
jgi:adenylate cyclase